MNLYRRGLSSGVKMGLIVVLAVVVLGVAYEYPALTSGGSKATSTYAGPATPLGQGQEAAGMYPLVTHFPDMVLNVYTFDSVNNILQNTTYSYSVLGAGTLNSTRYTRVEFVTVGQKGDDVVVWFNSTGGIGDVEVLGQGNYTGSGSWFFAQTYTGEFALIPTITNNATLLSILTKSSTATVSIGPTQANETTYVLAVPTPAYSSVTAKYATIPGTGVEMAVYLYERTHTGDTNIVVVRSVTT